MKKASLFPPAMVIPVTRKDERTHILIFGPAGRKKGAVLFMWCAAPLPALLEGLLDGVTIPLPGASITKHLNAGKTCFQESRP